MKFTFAFLIVALCSSLGTGNPVARQRRQSVQTKYTYYQTGNQGSVSGGYGGNQVQQSQISQQQARMFAFMYQGCCCLFNAVKNGPAENKPQKYKFVVENLITFVEYTAANFGYKSSNELFSNPTDLQSYQQMCSIARSGDYSNIDRVESCAGGLLTGLGGSFGGILKLAGIAVDEVLGLVTGLLGGLTGGLLGGITGALNGVLGGVLGGLTGTVGGLTGGLTGAVGGLTGGLLGGGKNGGGLLGGLLGGSKSGGGGGGGLLGGFLGR